MIKGVVSGDYHLGLSTDGLDRSKDILSIALSIVQAAITEKCKYFFHVGDLFDSEEPSPDHISWIVSLMNILESYKIESYFIPGNHDTDGRVGRTHALQPFKRFPYNHIHIIDDVEYIETKKFGFLFLPHIPKSVTIAKANMEPTDYMEAKSREFYKQMSKDKNNYVFGHLNIAGAVSGSEEFMLKGDHETFPEFLKDAKKIQLIFNGHIHKTQILGDNKIPIILPGSTECINMGERKDKKHYVIFDM